MKEIQCFDGGTKHIATIYSQLIYLQEVHVSNVKKLTTESQLKQAHFSRSFSSGTNMSHEVYRGDAYGASCWHQDSCCGRPSIIDRYSRVMFPLSFLVFNVLYWLIYLYISNSERKETDFLIFNAS